MHEQLQNLIYNWKYFLHALECVTFLATSEDAARREIFKPIFKMIHRAYNNNGPDFAMAVFLDEWSEMPDISIVYVYEFIKRGNPHAAEIMKSNVDELCTEKPELAMIIHLE